MTELIETIAAISTPYGEGGIGVIRISGSEATDIADRVFLALDGKPLKSGRGYSVRLGSVFSGGEAIDDALALLFRAPKSYTGEDVVELQCHGGPILLQKAVDVLDGDTPETLQKRVMEQAEWKTLPKAVAMLCEKNFA